MESDLVVVGVLARIDTDDPKVSQRLNAIEGVETFELPEAEKLGILIEARDIDAAHQRLTDEIVTTQGVLGTWPVALEIDDLGQTASVADPTPSSPPSPTHPDPMFTRGPR